MNEELIELLHRIHRELEEIKFNQEMLNRTSKEELENQERIVKLLNEIVYSDKK